MVTEACWGVKGIPNELRQPASSSADAIPSVRNTRDSARRTSGLADPPFPDNADLDGNSRAAVGAVVQRQYVAFGEIYINDGTGIWSGNHRSPPTHGTQPVAQSRPHVGLAGQGCHDLDPLIDRHRGEQTLTDLQPTFVFSGPTEVGSVILNRIHGFLSGVSTERSRS